MKLTDKSIKHDRQIETFSNSLQEEGMLKIYYACELFLYDYSKQTESKLFHKMYLK